MTEEGTVGQRYKLLIREFTDLDDNRLPKNSESYQRTLSKLINDFKLIHKVVIELDLFSDNEFVEEINVNYLPFLSIDYYLGELYTNFMADDKLDISLDYKPSNLKTSREYFNKYLTKLIELELLNSLQVKQFKGYNLSRDEKILQYRYEKELQGKLSLIDTTEDEDIKRQLYLDQINFFTIKTLNQLPMIDMELQVLDKRPIDVSDDKKAPERPKRDADGYTTRLETIPGNQPFSKLVNNGKVLQPFVLTRKELKNKVFGTGQVLPSMSVEEYLDYELANGLMAKQEEPKPEPDSDADDEEEEYRKREWDDWKDANPKGAGNTQNLG